MKQALKINKKGWRVFALPGTAFAACFGMFLFVKAGTLLAVHDPVPPRLDIVFTFAGENQRIAYSRELMRQFPDAHWVLSDYFHFFSHILQRDGFAMSRISFLDTCANTFSEVNGLKDWINVHKDSLYKKSGDRVLAIGLVSNPFHLRRIQLMTRKVFHDDAKVRLYYLPVPLDRYHWTPRDISFWWQTKTTRSWVTSETGKILAFWVLGALGS